jgi:hypothetical protein
MRGLRCSKRTRQEYAKQPEENPERILKGKSHFCCDNAPCKTTKKTEKG